MYFFFAHQNDGDLVHYKIHFKFKPQRIQTPFSLPFTLFLSFYSRLPLAIRPTILLCSALQHLYLIKPFGFLSCFQSFGGDLEACWKRFFIFSLRYIARSSLWGLSVSKMDRNSSLVQDVIDEILGLNATGKALKTSISSGNPKYVENWARHPVVVVDSNFWEEYSTRNQLDRGAVAEIVSGILHNHKGPIRNLILCIPQLLVEVVPVIQYDWAQHINNWMYSLPQNDIEELILYNYNDETYRISFLNLLVNLTRLFLGSCIFNQPFEGFGNLHCIRLDNIEFGSDMVGTVTYNFPNLTFFKAVNCSGFRHLKIEAPNLERFNVCVTKGDGISMYEWDQIGLKLDIKSVEGVDLVFDEGLVYLIELSILCRPQKEETCRGTMISYRIFSSGSFYNPELEPNPRKWSRRFPSRKMICFRKLSKGRFFGFSGYSSFLCL
ncbi:unnamed protein product [Camellia sinensis]